MPNDTKLTKSAEVSTDLPQPISRLNRQNSAKGRPRGRPFPKGHSGRPKGARNRASLMLERMFDGEAEQIGRKAIELAKDGTLGAVKLIIDRAYPTPRNRPVEGLTLPPIANAADAVAALGTITAAVTGGVISIEEGRDLSTLVDNFRKAHELADIDRRITALEREDANASIRYEG